MAEDTTTKKILIDVQLKSDQLKGDVVALNTTLDTLLVKQFQLKSAGQQNTKEFVGLASEIRNVKTAIREANKDIDNSSKALNAQSGSINQTKALVAILTTEYNKLSTSQGKTAASTIALGNKLKEATELLNKQRQAVSNNTSNIGNYTQSILAAIPGLGKYSQMLTQATNAFNLMGNASKAAMESEASAAGEATVSMEGLSGGTLAAAGAFSALAIAVVAIIAYLKELDPVTDTIAQKWAGLKASANSLGNAIVNMDFKGLTGRMNGARVVAEELENQTQTLADRQLAASVTQQQAELDIADLQLKLKNRRNTPEQEKKYFEEIQKISKNNYAVQKAIANDQYEFAVDKAINEGNLSDKQIKALRKGGVEAALVLENSGDILSGHTKQIADAQKAQISAERTNELTLQRAQNRNDSFDVKQEAAAEKERQLQQTIIKDTKQAQSETIASYQRTLAFKQTAFGKELSQTAEHYRQLIFKEQEFIDKQQAIADNPKNSRKTRTLAGKAVGAGKSNIEAAKNEQYTSLEKLLSDHHKSVIAETQKAANDLAQYQIQSITDEQDRETAANNLDYKEKTEALDKQIVLIKENKDKLSVQYKTAKADERAALKEEYDKEQSLLESAIDKKTETQLQYQQKQIDIVKKAADKKLSIENQIAILDAQGKKGFGGGKDNPFNSDLQSAKQKALLDNYNAEVSQKGLTEEAKLLIEKEYLAKSKELREQNEHDKRDMIVNGAQQVASAGLTIISNALKSEQQANEVKMSKQKDRELSNTSLTSATKAAIENKYRILEGQAKVKAFRAEQKLALAKGAIDTAASIIKASPNPILIALAAATGALELGVIASQKPPAFAKGGTFRSDGKGSVLPGYSRRDNVNAQLRSGEAVIVSEAVRDPYARSILSGINQAFGGRSFGETNPGRGYAIGGIVTDGNNSNRYYAQPQLGTENLANTIAYSLINNFPPIITQVRDINNQQGILAKTVNRVDI